MKNRPKGLGRGLDALFGDSSLPDKTRVEPTTPTVSSTPAGVRMAYIPLDAIQVSPFQPRRHLDQQALLDLAQSLLAHGLIQPIVVRPLAEEGRYELVAGERRWRAARLAHFDHILSHVTTPSDKDVAALALIENIQRENLNVIEEATAIKRLIDEFQMTHEQISHSIGRSRTATTNLLRLLQLSAPVQRMLEEHALNMGHARALLSLSSEDQEVVAQRIVEKGLSVRQTEELVRALSKEGVLATGETSMVSVGLQPRVDRDVLRLQESLADVLGAEVTVRPKRAGGAIVQIDFSNFDEMEELLHRLRLEVEGKADV